jgi:hypothetical protein
MAASVRSESAEAVCCGCASVDAGCRAGAAAAGPADITDKAAKTENAMKIVNTDIFVAVFLRTVLK